nr:hypothetical protein [Oligoflexus tunisiensis]
MLNKGRQSHIKWGSQFLGGARTLAQPFEYGAPGGVRKGLEYVIQL